MENIIKKIANKTPLTDEDWKEINSVLEDVYGWDEEDNPDEADRIWNFLLILAKDKLEDYNTVQLLDVLGY